MVLQRRERSAGGEARDGIRPHALASIAGTFFEWTALLASACVVAGVALDSIGLRFSPVSITIAALLVLAPFALPHLRDRRRRGIDWPTDLVVLLIGSAVAWQLLAPVGAALLPVGNSVDAVHHASLARYILQHGGLVREPALAVPQLGEMVDYPPGFALLAALLAGTLGTQAYAVVHALASMAVALTACGIALLAAEGASGTARTAAAAAGLLLLFVPGYSLGIVAAENYYAQALAQCLIVACAYVAARARQARLPIAAGKLGLLLLALVFVYTTWLPVALIAVGAGLLARGERPAARLLTGVVVLGGAAALALLFAGPRASTGSSVVLHEGSTIRDPLGATGWILPLLAAAGLPLGAIRRERWSGLGLIGGTLLLLAVFGVLWLRGAVAGYIYFKVFYLLAIVLPLPIGWLAAGAVQWQIARRPRLVRAIFRARGWRRAYRRSRLGMAAVAAFDGKRSGSPAHACAGAGRALAGAARRKRGYVRVAAAGSAGVLGFRRATGQRTRRYGRAAAARSAGILRRVVLRPASSALSAARKRNRAAITGRDRRSFQQRQRVGAGKNRGLPRCDRARPAAVDILPDCRRRRPARNPAPYCRRRSGCRVERSTCRRGRRYCAGDAQRSAAGRRRLERARPRFRCSFAHVRDRRRRRPAQRHSAGRRRAPGRLQYSAAAAASGADCCPTRARGLRKRRLRRGCAGRIVELCVTRRAYDIAWPAGDCRRSAGAATARSGRGDRARRSLARAYNVESGRRANVGATLERTGGQSTSVMSPLCS